MRLVSRMRHKLARRVIWPSATCVLQSRRGCICQDRPSARPRHIAFVATADTIQDRPCCTCNQPFRGCSILGISKGQRARFVAFAQFSGEMRHEIRRFGKICAAARGASPQAPAESADGDHAATPSGRGHRKRVRSRMNHIPVKPMIVMGTGSNRPTNVH